MNWNIFKRRWNPSKWIDKVNKHRQTEFNWLQTKTSRWKFILAFDDESFLCLPDEFYVIEYFWSIQKINIWIFFCKWAFMNQFRISTLLIYPVIDFSKIVTITITFVEHLHIRWHPIRNACWPLSLPNLASRKKTIPLADDSNHLESWKIRQKIAQKITT